MGNPGVGKSAILNALGGSFYSGFSFITGNPGSSKQNVTLGDKIVELIDLPGIADAGGGETMSDNLKMLQDTLNSCGKALLFFVIKPNNGRISPEDFAILKTLLTNLSKSPKIGLFVTQVREDHIPLLDKDEYRKTVLKMLQDNGVDTAYLEATRWSILRQHQAEGFSEAEKKSIRKYVDSFVSAEVQVNNLIVRIFKQIVDFFKRLFGG
jgi:GTPase Era involved in 16S rRNA processing